MAEVKNLHIPVNGAVSSAHVTAFKKLDVIVTNDGIGKTISINDGYVQFTIPFEPIEKYLK